MENNDKLINMHEEEELKGLEIRVDQLIKTCEQLKEENRLLRSQQQAYTSERASLLDRQEQARVKVEAMLAKLKSIEND